jgi:hypothetical protein
MLRANELHSFYPGGALKAGIQLIERVMHTEYRCAIRSVLMSQMDEIKRFVPIAMIMNGNY